MEGYQKSKDPAEHPNANGQNECYIVKWLLLDIQIQMLIFWEQERYV